MRPHRRHGCAAHGEPGERIGAFQRGPDSALVGDGCLRLNECRPSETEKRGYCDNGLDHVRKAH